MLRFIGKWIIASLVFPVIALASVMSGIRLTTMLTNMMSFFWPGSFVFLAMNSQSTSLDIIYIWSIAVLLNLVLYSVIGGVLYLLLYKLTEPK